MIVSLFDCDGTLYGAQFGRGLLKYSSLHGFINRVRKYYAAMLPRYVLRKLRLIDAEDFNRPVLAKLSRLTAGWDIEMGAAAFGWVANEFLLPTKHSDVLARLHSHQAEEHRVVLLSGVFLPCLELIGAHLGVRDLIGTRLEIHEDKYTGSIIPPIITGKDKLPALRDFIATRGLDVDWQASFAYADSIYDRSILEAVGNPVAANPDSELLALARARDWEVLEGE